MKRNIGSVDKALRIIIGISLVMFGIYTLSLWGVVGIVLLLTGISGWCPLYVPFGICTYHRNKEAG